MTTQTPRKEIGLSPEMTLKDLTPQVAGLLCYVAGWVSGIVFLVLEQKNNFVRFHALQSIIVFGILTVAGAVLGRIPILGTGLGIAISVLGFGLWLLLMVKSNQGVAYKLPWVGELAEKLALDSMSAPQSPAPAKPGSAEAVVQAAPTPNPATAAASAATGEVPNQTAPSAAALSAREAWRAKYYSYTSRTGRVVGSSFVIAWSVALLIFFNFFSQYIAFYQGITTGGQSSWQIYTVVTPDLNLWLPILNATLALAILGHALFIVYDRYLLRQVGRLVLGVLGLVSVISLLIIFPFDFNAIPHADVSYWAPLSTAGTLIVIAVGIAIGSVVRFIKLIVHLAEGKY